MKKSICVMTSEESFMNNYGAALQGCALVDVLRRLHFEPYIVRYDGYVPPRKFVWMKDIVKKLIGYQGHQPTQEQVARAKQLQELELQYHNEITLRKEYFHRFQMDNMVFYSEQRMHWDDLKQNPPDYDYYLCGSDQIWNPYFHCGKCDPGYFLSFAPKGKRCIAYAPSTGTDTYPKSFRKDVRRKLRRFSAVSVREQSSAVALSAIIGRKIDSVLDPTMLAEPALWERIGIVPERIPEKYILCYRFSDNPEIVDTLLQLSKKKNLPVISVPLSMVALEDPFEKVFRAGPAEFVGLIMNAKIVVTDSFHATAFSILLHKPFITFARECFDGNASMNTRIVDLLINCGLIERYVTSAQAAIQRIEEEFSFDIADRWIEFERTRSMKYLQDALK